MIGYKFSRMACRNHKGEPKGNLRGTSGEQNMCVKYFLYLMQLIFSAFNICQVHQSIDIKIEYLVINLFIGI
jgi:hypothetical protein